MLPHALIDRLDSRTGDEALVVLATLIAATGSSSKKVGARMVVGESGRLLGGVTIGGCVDAQVIEAADALVETGGRRMLSISLDDDEAWEIGLTCGGTVQVFVERLGTHGVGDPIRDALKAAHAALERGQAVRVIASLDDSPAALVVSDDGERHGSLGSALLDNAGAAIASISPGGASRVEWIGHRQYFVDCIAPPTTLAIVGAGEIAIFLTRMARELDMRTIVVDGRERYATRERFPDADAIRVGMPSEIIAAIPATRHVAVALVAHDYKYELPILRRLLREPIGYLGMLGSRKRGAAVRSILTDEGFTAEELARIHTPIGLDLGGTRPPEVALSILAEIVAVRSGRQA